MLGLAQLWSNYNEDVAALLSATDIAQIKAHFGGHHGDVDGNPVIKIQLEVLRVRTMPIAMNNCNNHNTSH